MKRALLASSCAALALGAGTASPAQAQDYFLGQLMTFGFDFCPRGWADTSGQLLAISQNTALFSLLGTTYGGNGVTTFALPDLRGRVNIHAGQGPGLSNYVQGQAGGSETTTLLLTQMPAHNHLATMYGDKDTIADRGSPAGAVLARSQAANIYSKTPVSLDDAMATGSVVLGNSGGGQPFSQLQPYLTLKWCIATQGIFPSRN